jgi:hypothetical protein
MVRGLILAATLVALWSRTDWRACLARGASGGRRVNVAEWHPASVSRVLDPLLRFAQAMTRRGRRLQ